MVKVKCHTIVTKLYIKVSFRMMRRMEWDLLSLKMVLIFMANLKLINNIMGNSQVKEIIKSKILLDFGMDLKSKEKVSYRLKI